MIDFEKQMNIDLTLAARLRGHADWYEKRGDLAEAKRYRDHADRAQRRADDAAIRLRADEVETFMELG